MIVFIPVFAAGVYMIIKIPAVKHESQLLSVIEPFLSVSDPVTDTIKGLTVSAALTGALIVLSFIIVDRCRIFRRNESQSLFVFILLAGIPLNVMVCRFFFWILSDIEEPGGGIVRLLAVPLVYCIMISFEEISCGIIGRLIWRYQKPMFL